MKRIFLIGYMGSGKTTVGKLLAEALGYSFVDMDTYIEEKQFKTVTQIFAEKGEDEFRLLEQNCLYEVSQFENVVISTGGGTPCFFDNMDFMNKQGITIYLHYTPSELASRLLASHANKRPLLAYRKGEEISQFVAEGLAKREYYYKKANYSIAGDVDYVVSQICKLMEIS